MTGDKSIQEFLMAEGLKPDKVKEIAVVAGDSNITPHKVRKKMSGLKPDADLSKHIAFALSQISSKGADKWCVFMANVKVGKRRVGFSLMNTQIFKSEPKAGGNNPVPCHFL